MCHSCKAPHFEEGQIVILLPICFCSLIQYSFYIYQVRGNRALTIPGVSIDKSIYDSPARMHDVCVGGKARSLGTTQDGDAL